MQTSFLDDQRKVLVLSELAVRDNPREASSHRHLHLSKQELSEEKASREKTNQEHEQSIPGQLGLRGGPRRPLRKAGGDEKLSIRLRKMEAYLVGFGKMRHAFGIDAINA